jgi:hypothetical protein
MIGINERDCISKLAKKLGTSPKDVLVSMSSICTNTKFYFDENLSVGPFKKAKASDIVKSHDDIVSGILADIKSSGLSTDIEDGKLSESAVTALAETLSRVDSAKYRSESKTLLENSPEHVYAWAIANANISFPYLCLSEAEKHITRSARAIVRESYWGLKDGRFILPKLESTSTSNAWIVLTQLLINLVGKERVEFSYDIDDTVPDLYNDDIAKDVLAEAAILRMLELAKTPNTATFRSGKKLSEADIARNSVDFVILDKLYQERSGSYKNLTTSGSVVSQCRMTERVEKNDGKKITISLLYTGYRLYDIFGKYINRRISKNIENEPFMRFLIDICDLLREKVSDDFVIPRSYFMPPSEQLRLKVRRGPNVKRKGGKVKANLYIPFSFAKSKECSLLPEKTKKTMVDIGSKIIKSIDKINKLPVIEANKQFKVYEEYIETTYRISDECRKKWRLNCSIPKIEDLELAFYLEDDASDYKISGDTVKLLKGITFQFKPFTNNSEELAETRKFISDLNESRRKKRLNAPSSKAD